MSGKAVRRQRRARDNAPDGTGSGRSYEELYVEYAPAARGLALSMVPPDVADDIVAEAFARVLAAIRAGGGPDHAFRAYLLAAVRNLANDWMAARRRMTVIGNMGEEPGDRSALMVSGFSRDAETEAEARAEARLVVRAFSRLPERWRTVLWQLEVEGRAPADVAPMFGLSGNGVSALAMRAREGLRQAYLQEHIGTNIPASCRACAGNLGAGTRGRLSPRRRAAMQDHLGHCPACQDLFTELSELNRKLGTILAPIALAGASAALHTGRHALLRAWLSAHWRAMRWHPVTAAAGAAASVAVAGGMVFAVNITPLPGAPSHVAVRPAGPVASSGTSAGHHADGRRGGGGGGGGGGAGSGAGAAGGTLTGAGAPVAGAPLGAADLAPIIGTAPLASELPSSGTSLAGTVGGAVTGATSTVVTTVSGLTGTVGTAANGLAKTAAVTVSGVAGAVSGTVNGVASTAGTAVNDVASTADHAVTGAASTVTSAASTVAGTADTAATAATGTVGAVAGAAADAVTNVAGTAASTGDAAAPSASTTGSAVSGAATVVGSAVSTGSNTAASGGGGVTGVVTGVVGAALG